MYNLTPPRGGALSFRMFMLSQTVRIACYSDVGGCADRRVAAERVSQEGEVLAAELEKKMVTQGGVRRVL
jgi:hypothetical protein